MRSIYFVTYSCVDAKKDSKNYSESGLDHKNAEPFKIKYNLILSSQVGLNLASLVLSDSSGLRPFKTVSHLCCQRL